MRDEIIAVLRRQAWERAKGEMNAMLNASYLPDGLSSYVDIKAHEKAFSEWQDKVRKFMREIDDGKFIG